MTCDPPTGPDRPLRITRGAPTPEEVAAVVGVLLGRRTPPPAPTRARAAWAAAARPGAARRGADAWRHAARPR
ncbi:MAG TPA: acyl-CoA carboxylase epsilon subunit [Pilimelia sp.]|nr:acyl-CoA carboxylase epsilon subunit [Pilimelia sp.]